MVAMIEACSKDFLAGVISKVTEDGIALNIREISVHINPEDKR